MNKYTERLTKEWLQYGKIVIAVDFDSTIYPWPTIENDEDRALVVKTLQIARETGAYIVINTCSHPDRHAEIQDWCEKIRLPIDGINVSPIELPYGNHGKIYANIYLDDRAGLMEALKTLEDAMYIVRGKQMSKLTEGESI